MKNIVIGSFIFLGGYHYLSYDESIKYVEPKRFKNNTNIEIKLIDASVVDENGIGDDWYFTSNIGDSTKINRIGTLVDVSDKYLLEINSIAIEEDPSHDDIGEGRIKIKPEDIKTIPSQIEMSDTIRVREYHGPGAGGVAICIFKYLVKIDTLKSRDSITNELIKKWVD